ncbi:MAG TPA: xylulokinase [Fervidobacterium sp.]|nr:xylulokinase [Fervidobacterium sp.]HOH53517.1 xylulokinase [Fervidobacterium sp.]
MYAGLDIGTTSIKLIVVDEDGKIIFKDAQGVKLYSPKSGWYEQNPNDWWNAAKKLLSNAAKEGIEIKAIGLTGQMHSLVLVDVNGNVVRPAILWNDQRCYDETIQLTQSLGGEERVIDELGNPILTGFTAPKLLWVKNNEYENYKSSVLFMLPKDFIAWKLSGSIHTEPSDASATSLFDVKNNTWSQRAFEIFSDSSIKLPKILPSDAIVGQIPQSLANELGLKNRSYIVAGGADNACALLGMGGLKENQMVLSLGTSGTVIVTTKEYKPDFTGRVHTFRHVINDMYYHMGVILSATYSLDWYLNLIGKGKDVESVVQEAEGTLPCENGVFFLPYLSGERTPHRNPDARGVLFGLSGNTAQKTITRAILEGVAFAMNDCKDALSDLDNVPQIARITGGGSKSQLWLKIIASISNLTLQTMQKNEGAAFGAAMLGGMAFKADVEKWNNVQEQINPVEEWTEPYKKGVRYYRTLYTTLKELMSQTREFER